jgi:3-hydroxyisobutyrate dehydrogenase
MDLVCKDVGLFDKLTKKYDIPAELSSLMLEIFQRGRKNLGDRALSTSIVKLLEEKCNENLRASGFPSHLEDKNQKQEAEEVII